MKKLFIIAALGISLVGCTSTTNGNTSSVETTSETENVEIKQSPDKYTWYMQNYVGKNLASIGYYSLGGDLLDAYGEGYMELKLITPEGEYIDISEEDARKEYAVVEQSYAPNTEIKYTFEKDEDGNEYDNLIEWQNIEQIDLVVKKVGENSSNLPATVEINPSPNKYTYYVRNYVGKNVSETGYVSLGGDLLDAYGSVHLEIILMTDDGTYIDINDEDMMKEYYVVSQDVAANTEISCTYDTDEDGNEYSNLINTQNIEKITLNCKKVAE